MTRPVVIPRRWATATALVVASAAAVATTASAAGPVGPPRVATAVAAAAGAPCAAAVVGAPAAYPPAGAVADGKGSWVVVPPAGAAKTAAPRPPPALPSLPLVEVAATAAPATAAVVTTPPPLAEAAPYSPPPPAPVVAAAPPPVAAPAPFPVEAVAEETSAPAPLPPAVAPVGTLPPPPAAAPPFAPALPAAAPFIPPPRCPSFPPFNLYAVGPVTLTGSEVLGPLACGGDATLTGFSINYNSTCDPAGPLALAVGGTLTASSGQVVNGGIAVGAPLPQTVGQVCTHAVPAAGAVDFPRLTADAVAASAALCNGPSPVACVTRTDDGGGVVFDVSAAAAGSLAVCTVPGRVLTAATGVTVAGRGSPASTVVAINVVAGGGGGAAAAAGGAGAAVRLVGCEFFGFTPATTVLNFCAGVRTLTVDNVGVPAAVLAPAVAVNGPAGHVRGSVVAAAVDTGVEFRNEPFAC